VAHGEAVRTEPLTSIPFRRAADAWLDSRRPYLSAKTAHEYELNIKTLSAYFGEMHLQEITPDQVRAYQKMRMTQCGPFSINHECCVLNQMRKRIGQPFEDYQPLPLPKEARGRALRDDERAKLMQYAASNPNWEGAYLFARLSANTTAGPKECMTLRLKDVDIPNRLIVVQPEGAKNAHRHRPIPLNEDALAAVQLAIVRAQRLGAHLPEHYLFPFRTDKGKRHDPGRHQTTFKTAWKKLIVTADLAPLRMYDLRHTAITNLLKDPKVSDKTAEDLAGHIDPRMKKRYSHIHIETLREAVAQIGPKKPVKSAEKSNVQEPGQDFNKAAQDLLSALAMLLKTRA
jgi:integrase